MKTAICKISDVSLQNSGSSINVFSSQTSVLNSLISHGPIYAGDALFGNHNQFLKSNITTNTTKYAWRPWIY